MSWPLVGSAIFADCGSCGLFKGLAMNSCLSATDGFVYCTAGADLSPLHSYLKDVQSKEGQDHSKEVRNAAYAGWASTLQ